MRPFRVLHIDDDPALRDIVEMSLGFDPAFAPASCASGAEAVALAAVWLPDLILCDVMMPDMDGPATLTRLRETAATARIPVMFMTANPEPDDIAHYKSIGAAGVIAKPFDPACFAGTVRSHCRSLAAAGLIAAAPDDFNAPDLSTDLAPDTRALYMSAAADDFSLRLRQDSTTLLSLREALSLGAQNAAQAVEHCAHKLAGAAGIFGFAGVSEAAAALEAAATSREPAHITPRLDALVACIASEGGHA